MLQLGTIDWHRMCRRAMDFTALVGGLLVAVLMLRRVRVIPGGAVMAHVACRCLALEIRAGVKTRGIGRGKQARLESRHDQEYDRQQSTERYAS
ncbi:MAG: hypothetical protein E5W81_01875 [Mesorhizobium sp.]|nr:MAG: hypothetical protein E5W81_01875 [Mesorhizobium sp.]